jgi:peptide deformylase
MQSVLQVGHPVLRQRARPLEVPEILSDPIQQLIVLMHDTMREAPGVGLAAPQIGISLQLAVLEDREELLKSLDPNVLIERERRPVPFQVIINPTITLDHETVEFFEGCLSLSGFGALVPRARRVVVECLNERAEPVRIEASGWHARILQHEIDHLNGTVYIDRMRSRTFMTVDAYTQYWKEKTVEEMKGI